MSPPSNNNLKKNKILLTNVFMMEIWSNKTKKHINYKRTYLREKKPRYVVYSYKFLIKIMFDNIYIYIYPKGPIFDTINNVGLFKDIANSTKVLCPPKVI